MYIDVYQHIEDTGKRLGYESKTYQTLCQAARDHADLKAYLDGTVRLCSMGVNPFVDKMDFERGQTLYVHPFVNDKGSTIHSEPPFFYIGTRNSAGFGVFPALEWEEEMTLCGINKDLIKKVTEFLKANVPYDLAEEPSK